MILSVVEVLAAVRDGKPLEYRAGADGEWRPFDPGLVALVTFATAISEGREFRLGDDA